MLRGRLFTAVVSYAMVGTELAEPAWSGAFGWGWLGWGCFGWGWPGWVLRDPCHVHMFHCKMCYAQIGYAGGFRAFN